MRGSLWKRGVLGSGIPINSWVILRLLGLWWVVWRMVLWLGCHWFHWNTKNFAPLGFEGLMGLLELVQVMGGGIA